MAKGFTIPTAEQFGGSLARRLIPVTDKLNDLKTRFGVRPYRVDFVRVRYTGGIKNDGEEEEVQRTTILPTPRVSPFTAIHSRMMALGQVEEGDVMVSEISGSFSEDFFRGIDSTGAQPAADTGCFFEITFLATGQNPQVRRFILNGAPIYRTNTWTLTLKRTSSDDPVRAGGL